MSRTNHDTPSFPRDLRGPRGGRHRAPTPCAECVSFASCRPGSCSAPFGCDSWVNLDGLRIEPEPRIDYDAPDDLTAEDRRDGDPFELDEPDPDDPNPYKPSNATLSEMSGIFLTDDDPGPLFRGPASD